MQEKDKKWEKEREWETGQTEVRIRLSSLSYGFGKRDVTVTTQ